MKLLFKLIITILSVSPLSTYGQKVPKESYRDKKMPQDIRLPYSLYKLCEDANSKAIDLQSKIATLKLYQRADTKVKLEIENQSKLDSTIDIKQLKALGFEVDGFYRNRCNVWLYVSELISKAKILPKYYCILKSNIQHMNQGPSLMHSDTYINAGFGGQGIRIAIFDIGFAHYSEAGNNVPAFTKYYDHGNGRISEGGEVHGTACVETIFDHAPQSQYYLHKIATLTDLGNAVEDCKRDGVRIISHSLSYANTGWGDDSGGACDAANNASNNGILFFTASGNYNNGQHIQSEQLNGGTFHSWASGEEINSFTLNAGCEVSIHLQWPDGPDPVQDDYDLYLFSYQGNQAIEIKSSESAFTFEEIVYTNNTNQPQKLGIAVKQDGNDNNPFELFAYASDCSIELKYHSTSNNTQSPSNATGSNVIVVGAVHRAKYDDGTGANSITDYSSVGPTNNGRLNLDIVAPTSTTTFAYNGDFGGTSCATPNAAGATAAFWSSQINLSANQIRPILMRKATIYHDWGSAGTENTYGNGGLRLYNFSPNIVYIYRYLSFQSPSNQPYPNPTAANSHAPPNSNAIMLDQIFYEATPQNPIILNKKMTYRTAAVSSRID